ncbi:MAG: LytTR family DNA-binding domain-containing protein [Capnocytophaga sp.]|nr:LytTR family DNA-binding domain-containing protein [Capnocytophaga sp.]
MNRLEILIVEDEPLLAEALSRQLLSLDASVEIVGYLAGIEETVTWFQTNQCDLMFLDIHLNDGLSFTIFEKTEIGCPVIFTTAYNQYAIRAFEVNSIAYLLKPIAPEALAKAWNKFLKMKLLNQENDFREFVAYFQKNALPKAHKERLVLSKGNIHKPFKISDIAYFKAEDRYVFAITENNEKYFCEKTLSELEEMLNPNDFFRLNRAFLVSYESVETLRPYGKGKLAVTLRPLPQETVIASAAKANDFKLWLQQ